MVMSESQDEVNLVGGPLGCKAHVEGSPLEVLWRPVAKECGRLSRVRLLTGIRESLRPFCSKPLHGEGWGGEPALQG